MKKIMLILFVVLVVALTILKLVSNKKITKEKVYQFDIENPVSVLTDTVSVEQIKSGGFYAGIFEPNKETKISADIQGKINSVFVDVGEEVGKGQTLIQLDNSLLKLQLQTVEVQISGLEDDVKRFTILANADAVQGVQLEKAALGLKSAKVQRATLLEQISKTYIKAPFKGVVTAKLNEVGGFAAPGMPLLQITDINSLRFTINAPENDIRLFQLGKEYKVLADAYAEIPLLGRMIMISSKSNPGNLFPIQFQVNNTSTAQIKSGMFGKVFLSDNHDETGILIPSSSVIDEDGSPNVYLIKNGRAILHPIKITKNFGDRVLVENGLIAGDIYVTGGFINLFNNANVLIKD